MVLKVLAIIAALFIVYLIFFKKNRESEVGQKGGNKSTKNDSIEDILEECPTCKTYVSKKEAILSSGKYYCSKECLK